MIVDMQDLDSDSRIETDLCIVGAGAAGIAIAHALAGSGIRVCLLESGGFIIDSAVAALSSGDSTGQAETGLRPCRLRFFGGSTNHWAGWCRRFDATDFAKRPWIDHSGWPIGLEVLRPYYDLAHALCELGPDVPDPTALGGELTAFPAFDPNKIDGRLYQFSPPTRFGITYRADLEQAANVTVYLNANVTGLDVDESASRVIAARAGTLRGRKAAFHAKSFVLATGGIENARLLLASNSVQKEGLGNGSDCVGRYFAQHLELEIGKVVATESEVLKRYFDERRQDGKIWRPEIGVSPAAQERLGILHCAFTIRIDNVRPIGFHALRWIWKEAKKAQWPEELDEKASAVMEDLSGVAERALHDREKEGQRYFAIKIRSEQAPNPDSRVTLSGTKDVLGVPVPSVHWQLTELDWRSIQVAVQQVAEEFGRLNIGRIKLDERFTAKEPNWPSFLFGGCHHIGTTRMTSNPREGVVDQNCRVHTIGNLYMAGSSVFPTGSYSAPTLTLVTLALRLAEHLKKELAAA